MRFDYKTIKKDELLRILICISIAVFTLCFKGVALADDAVLCGDTIGPEETVTLKNNIGPCSDSPALKIEGPARLNLNGFTVVGNGTADEEATVDGISVNGERAIIHNGTVRKCKIAVNVEKNSGHHQIFNLTVDNNKEGIRIGEGSFRNHVINNIVTNNKDRGIRLDKGSDENTVINNFADSSNKGFRIDGNNNNILGNEANNNAKENFQVQGNNNRLLNNTANGGPEECFLIDGGNENRLINNHATDCTDGIVLSDGAEGNYIINNHATGNGTDLIDENCDGNNNVWKKNKFVNQYGDCIE